MSVDFKEYSRKMDRTLDHLEEDFDAVRAGQTPRFWIGFPCNTMEVKRP